MNRRASFLPCKMGSIENSLSSKCHQASSLNTSSTISHRSKLSTTTPTWLKLLICCSSSQTGGPKTNSTTSDSNHNTHSSRSSPKSNNCHTKHCRLRYKPRWARLTDYTEARRTCKTKWAHLRATISFWRRSCPRWKRRWCRSKSRWRRPNKRRTAIN